MSNIDLKKRRSAIKKMVSVEEEPDRAVLETQLKRRISFSEKKSVRVFCGEEEPKTWDNSYEVSDYANGLSAEGTQISIGERSSHGATKNGLSAANKENININISQEVHLQDHCSRKNATIGRADELSRLTFSNTLDFIDKVQSAENSNLLIENTVDITLLHKELNPNRVLLNTFLKKNLENVDQGICRPSISFYREEVELQTRPKYQVADESLGMWFDTAPKAHYVQSEKMPDRTTIDTDYSSNSAPRRNTTYCADMEQSILERLDNQRLDDENLQVDEMQDMMISSPLFPVEIITNSNRKLNLRQLNDEIEHGKIQIYPDALKTSITGRKLSRMNACHPDSNTEIATEDYTGEHKGKRLFFNVNDLHNVSGMQLTKQKEIANVSTVSGNRPDSRRKQSIRFSEADDMLLDNTSYLTHAKLGDETVSRSSSKCSSAKKRDVLGMETVNNMCDKRTVKLVNDLDEPIKQTAPYYKLCNNLADVKKNWEVVTDKVAFDRTVFEDVEMDYDSPISSLGEALKLSPVTPKTIIDQEISADNIGIHNNNASTATSNIKRRNTLYFDGVNGDMSFEGTEGNPERLEDSLKLKLEETRAATFNKDKIKTVLYTTNDNIYMSPVIPTTPHRSCIEFEYLEREARIEQTLSEQEVIQPDNSLIDELVQRSSNSRRTVCGLDDIVFDVSGLKPLENEKTASKLFLSPVVREDTKKRLTANLTPNFPLSKKRTTLIFNDCHLDESREETTNLVENVNLAKQAMKPTAAMQTLLVSKDINVVEEPLESINVIQQSADFEASMEVTCTDWNRNDRPQGQNHHSMKCPIQDFDESKGNGVNLICSYSYKLAGTSKALDSSDLGTETNEAKEESYDSIMDITKTDGIIENGNNFDLEGDNRELSEVKSNSLMDISEVTDHGADPDNSDLGRTDSKPVVGCSANCNNSDRELQQFSGPNLHSVLQTTKMSGKFIELDNLHLGSTTKKSSGIYSDSIMEITKITDFHTDSYDLKLESGDMKLIVEQSNSVLEITKVGGIDHCLDNSDSDIEHRKSPSIHVEKLNTPNFISGMEITKYGDINNSEMQNRAYLSSSDVVGLENLDLGERVNLKKSEINPLPVMNHGNEEGTFIDNNCSTDHLSPVRVNPSKIPVLIGSAKKRGCVLSELQGNSYKKMNESDLNKTIDLQIVRGSSYLQQCHNEQHNVPVNIQVDDEQPAVNLMFENNPITISDVSVHYSALRQNSLRNNEREFVSAKTANDNRTKLHEPRKSSPLLSCEQNTIHNFTNFKNNYINLTCDANILGVVESPDIENTRLSLVETILDDVEVDGSIEVEKNQSVIDPAPVKSTSSVNNSRSTSMCRKCKRCQDTIGNETTYIVDSFLHPEIPALPDLGLNKLKRLRSRPTIADVQEYWRRLSLNRPLDSTNSSTDLSLNTSEGEYEKSASKYNADWIISKYTKDLKRDELEVVETQLRPLTSIRKSFVQRLDSLFSTRLPNWIFDFQMQQRNMLLFNYTKIKTSSIVICYEEKDVMGTDIEITNIQLTPNRQFPEKNWKPFDYFLDFQVKLELPFNLKTSCRSSNEDDVMQMFIKIDQICADVVCMGKHMWRLICSEHASLLREDSRLLIKTTLRNIVERTYNEYPRIEKSEFQIEITNLRKVCYKDIACPSLHLFCEEIQLLPEGLDFLKLFLQSPTSYLKCA